MFTTLSLLAARRRLTGRRISGAMPFLRRLNCGRRLTIKRGRRLPILPTPAIRSEVEVAQRPTLRPRPLVLRCCCTTPIAFCYWVRSSLACGPNCRSGQTTTGHLIGARGLICRKEEGGLQRRNEGRLTA